MRPTANGSLASRIRNRGLFRTTWFTPSSSQSSEQAPPAISPRGFQNEDLAPVTVGKRAPVRSGRLDRRAQGAEYAVREGGVDHKGDDGAATTTRTVEN